jgi:hypothetical protein
VTDPRPSWAVPLSWEVRAKALGGRREALIRWGMFTDAISYRRICRLSQSLRTKKLAVWGSCFVPGEPPMNRPLRELCAERNRGKFGHEKYHKRLENITDNAGGQGTVAWTAPPAGLAEIQQKRTSLQIPAQSPISIVRLNVNRIACKAIYSARTIAKHVRWEIAWPKEFARKMKPKLAPND